MSVCVVGNWNSTQKIKKSTPPKLPLVLLSRAQSGTPPVPHLGWYPLLFATSMGTLPPPSSSRTHLHVISVLSTPRGLANPPDPPGRQAGWGWVGLTSLLAGLMGSPGVQSSGLCWILSSQPNMPGQRESSRKSWCPVACPGWDGHWRGQGVVPRNAVWGRMGTGPGGSSPFWAGLPISDTVVRPSGLHALAFLGVSFPKHQQYLWGTTEGVLAFQYGGGEVHFLQ